MPVVGSGSCGLSQQAGLEFSLDQHKCSHNVSDSSCPIGTSPNSHDPGVFLTLETVSSRSRQDKPFDFLVTGGQPPVGRSSLGCPEFSPLLFPFSYPSTSWNLVKTIRRKCRKGSSTCFPMPIRELTWHGRCVPLQSLRRAHCSNLPRRN